MEKEVNEIYDRYRQELAHEDSLINQRLSWYFVAQTFLFATLGVSIKANSCALTIIVMLVGLGTSLLILISVAAAISSFKLCLRRLQNIQSLARFKEDYPQLNRSEKIIRFGFVAPVGLPIIFMLAWLAALIWLRSC